jgi:hypothetical protein
MRVQFKESFQSTEKKISIYTALRITSESLYICCSKREVTTASAQITKLTCNSIFVHYNYLNDF